MILTGMLLTGMILTGMLLTGVILTGMLLTGMILTGMPELLWGKKKLFQRHSIHQKSYMEWPGIEPGFRR